MAGKKAHFKKNVKPPLKWEVKCSKSRKSLKRRHPVKKGKSFCKDYYLTLWNTTIY